MSPLRDYLAVAASAPFSQFWLDVAVKATALLLAAILAAAILRRSSAALRHRVWCLTFAALVLLPVLSAALPKWRLPILPAVIEQKTVAEAPMRPSPQPLSNPVAEAGRTPLSERGFYETAPGRAAPTAEAATAMPPPQASLAASDEQANRSAKAPRLPGAARVWLLGAGLALSPLLLGLARMLILRRRSRPIGDAAWAGLLDELRARLGLARRVDLLETAAAVMPMTWGLLRPAVLLPSQAHGWTERLRRIVLLHELAHVKRCDVGFQLLGRAACGLYWFHPLAWYALRRLRIERELACDDCVVHTGELASDYAAELLQIARSYRPVPLAAAVAMAQRSNLEHRIRALFDRACSHLPVSARAARLLLAGVVVLVTAVAAVRLAPRAKAEDKKPDEAAEKIVTASKPKAAAESDDPIVVGGRVLDPDGKPFAGATIYAIGWYHSPESNRAPLGESKSNSDGRFEISYRNPKDSEAARLGRMSAKSQTIVATAEGFGSGFVSTETVPEKELTLRLVRDDVPVEGRVLDLEGRPVAGVRVKVLEIKASKGDDLSAWLDAIKRGEVNYAAARHLEALLPEHDVPDAAPIVTDAAGRYRVGGIGRERVARLLFTGPTIAYTEVDVVTRRVAPMQMVTRPFDKQTRPVYGADLDLAASPTQPIVGTVRDAETGKPLAGVTVANNNWLPGVVGSRLVRTVTDGAGRYRLAGLPKMSGIEILAIPNDEQPYFMQEAVVPDSPTLDPVAVDFELHRGIWITGRVTDKATGEPVPARVRYFPFLTNEYAQKRTPEFGTRNWNVHGSAFSERCTTRPDGAYRLVGLPGRAIIGADSPSRSYRFGVGAESIGGGPDQQGWFPTYHNAFQAGLKWPDSIREINPPADAESAVCDIELDPGEAIRVAVVDSNGNSVAGYKLEGDAPRRVALEARQDPSFDVINLGPEESRIVVVRHEQRKLGKVIELRLAEQPKRSLTVRLESCATVEGRLIDAEGDPVVAASVEAMVQPVADFSVRLPPVTTDEQGRFQYHDLPTGCAYSLVAETAGMFTSFATDLRLAAGETKNLGDVTNSSAVEDEKKPKADAGTKTTASEGAPAESDDLVTVSGTVVDPQGKPFAGAKIFAARWYWEPRIPHAPLAESKSDADGRFTISFRKSQFKEDVGRRDQWKETAIVATAEGAGPGWVTWRDVPPGEEPTLRLVPDDMPITGRVVDLEGNPVAGVRVRIGSIDNGKDGSLDGWLAAVRRGEFPWTAVKYLGDTLPQFDAWPPRVVTGSDGRFRINGIGRERRVKLSFTGPTIAYQEATVVTRQSDTLRLKVSTMSDESTPVYGADFELAAPPTQPIFGVVRDAQTREPLAGVSIESDMFAGSNFAYQRRLRAVSDEAGRYRLVGMPKGKGNRILALPNDDQPYLMREVDVPEARGLEPVEVDVELHRGIWITGRVTDRATGKPLIARLHYLPFVSNEFAQQTPEFGDSRSGDGFQTRYSSRPDGSYRLVGLPGRGIVGAECVIGHYRVGLGAEAIEGINDEGNFDTYLNPIQPGRKWPHAMKEINPATGTESVVCDLTLDPGDKITVKVLDGEGKPVIGYRTHGSGQTWFDSLHERSSFDVINLAPDETRTVFIRHKERKLGKVVRLRLSDAASHSVSVALDPTAKLSGRLIDRQGAPVSGAGITAFVHPLENFDEQLPTVTTDEQGRFEYADVPTGCHYDLDAEAAGMRKPGWFVTDLSLEPGETKDLGDVTYGSAVEREKKPKADAGTKTTAAASEPSERSSRVSLSGRVLNPQGQPLAGANVYFWVPGEEMHGLAPRDRTKADGTFEFAIDKTALKSSSEADPWSLARIIASVDGYGYESAQTDKPDAQGQYVIRLVNDVPIRGRILTLEGAPVARAKLTIRSVLCFRGNRLDEYIEAWKTGRVPFNPDRFARTPPAQAEVVETDANGQFSVSGIGAERVVDLLLEGDGIAHARLYVMTRQSEAIMPPESIGARMRPDRAHGATFTYLAQPSRVIRGMVRERGTRKPIAGVTVRGLSDASLIAKTDQAGRFELHGHAKAAKYYLDALGTVSPYFSASLIVADQPGLDPIDVDFELARGIEVQGRVTLAPSGQPNRAYVEYYPLYRNPYTDRIGSRFARPCSSAQCDADGRYTIPVLAGPGILTYAIGNLGWDHQKYMAAWLSQQEIMAFYESAGVKPPDDAIFDNNVPISLGGQVLSSIVPSSYNEVALINPPDGEASFTRDVELQLGRTLNVKLVDPDGKPVAGAVARGVANSAFKVEQLEGPEFTLLGLNPRVERPLIVESRERKLAAYKIILGDQSDLLTIQLVPCGTVIGRLLDAEGEPLGGTRLELGRQWYFPGDFAPTTDSQGEFRVEGVVPGMPYGLSLKLPGDVGQRRPAQDIIVAPGETKDLGDVRLKPPGMASRSDAPPSAGSKGSLAPTAQAKVDKGQQKRSTNEDRPPSTESASASGPTAVAERKFTLRGQVLSPDGNPAPGADLYGPHLKGQPPQSPDDIEYTKRATTDGEGRFQIALAQSDLPATAAPLGLVAHKSGFGIAWRQVARGQAPPDITLRLVEDRPIRGRVIDTEGRPVAGARVSVANVLTSRDGSLDSFLTAWKQNWQDSWMTLDRAGGSNLLPASIEGAITDDYGRFQLLGIGVERVAAIEITAAGYAYDQLQVVNRDGFDADAYNKIKLPGRMPAAQIRGMLPRLTGPSFEHVVEAELVIRGQVFTGGTRTPVAGARVYSASGGWSAGVSAVTDAAGRYELHGHPRNRPVSLGVVAPESSKLLDKWLHRNVAPTKAVLEIDVELKRGVVVEGRVFDRATGKGVAAGIDFVLLPDERFVDSEDAVAATVDDTGRFRLLVPAGPGVLMAQAHGDGARIDGVEINPYRQASFSQEDSQRVPTTFEGDHRYFTGRDNTLNFLTHENAVKVIEVAPNSKPVTYDLPLDRGRTAQIAIEDAQGRPVSDAFVSGLADCWPYTFRIAKPTCTVYGLGPDRPRHVCILHPERHLAGSVTLTGREKGPVKVRLAAPARITGRALAPDGQPLVGALVQINYVRHSASDLLRFVKLEQAPLKTDRDGRFHVEDIVPGKRFALDFKQGDTFFSAPLGSALGDSKGAQPQLGQWIQRMAGLFDERCELEPGQQLELGDVNVK